MNRHTPDFRALGRGFKDLVKDPRIETRATQFVEFVRNNHLRPENAKQAFKEYLGRIRVYRGLCLNTETNDCTSIFEDHVLYSKAAAVHGLYASLKKGQRVGYWRGIRARLHEPGTNYEEGDFVFSVAKFPEPQIVPVIDGMLISEGKGYLLEFDMPAFDLLKITIADIAGGDEKHPYLFRHLGILFNGSDPDVEIFALHKTHMSHLSYRRFDTPSEILEFCMPYNRMIEEQFCIRPR